MPLIQESLWRALIFGVGFSSSGDKECCGQNHRQILIRLYRPMSCLSMEKKSLTIFHPSSVIIPSLVP